MIYLFHRLQLPGWRWFLLFGCALFYTCTYRVASAAEDLLLTVNSVSDAVDASPGDGVCATAAGNGLCTLRAAVMETNARPGPDTIILPSGFYTLTLAGGLEQGAQTGDLDIFDHLTIHGEGAATTVIDGGGLDRIFDIVANHVIVALEGFTLRNGFCGGPLLGEENEGGAAIINRADLYLTATTLTQNVGPSTLRNKGRLTANGVVVALNDRGDPLAATFGAVENLGDMTLQNSQVISNSYTGIVSYAGTLSVISSTVAANQDGGIGGGPMTITGSVIRANVGNGITGFTASATVLHSEITDNTGSGIVYSYKPVLVEDSLIRGNGGKGIEAGNLTLRRSTVAQNRSGGVITRNFSTIDQSHIHDNQGALGGGVHSGGKLLLTRSIVANNLGTLGGGGIYSSNDILVTDSTISHNRTTGNGGGLYIVGAPLFLVNSTLSANHSDNQGGGIAAAVDLNQPTQAPTVTIHSSTIVSNTAIGSGGGLYAPLATIRLGNSVLANNTSRIPTAPQDCAAQQPLDSRGYNVVRSIEGCVLGGVTTGNQIGVDPQLGPLQDNGGKVQTHLPLPGSPLIDAGNPAGCASFDETLLFFDPRNYLRVADGNQDGTPRCDIGAAEFGDVRALPAFMPLVSVSSSSATLPSSPTQAQVAQTSSIVGFGLVLGGALFATVVVLFLTEQNEDQPPSGEAATVNAMPGAD